MLEESLSAVAAAGGTALIGAAATDGWTVAKNGVLGLFRRGGAANVATIEGRLEETRAAVDVDGPESEAARVHAAAWTTRLEDLLDGDPAAAGELRDLVSTLADLTRVRTAGHVQQRATASENARQAVLGHGQQTNHFGG